MEFIPLVGEIPPTPHEHLPDPLPGLEYRCETWPQGEYITTGLFEIGAPQKSEHFLQAVGVLFGDSDLCDWCERHAAWAVGMTRDAVKKHLQDLQAGTAEQIAEIEGYRAAHLQDIDRVCLEVYGKPPTVVVNSGYGVHVYYHLTQFARGEDMRAAKSLNKALQPALNHAAGYTLFEPHLYDTGTRILRIPGTQNTKGPAPAPVYVISRSDTKIDLHTFEILRPAPARTASPPKRARTWWAPPRKCPWTWAACGS